jgi:PAS domain S-box-containing protein
MHFISLRSKLLFGVVGLIVIPGLLFLLFLQSTISQKIEFEVKKRGVSFAIQLAKDLTAPILTGDIFDIQLLVIEAAESEEPFEYIFVLDRDNKPISHSFKYGFPEGLREANIISPGQEYNIQSLITEKGNIFDIGVPILRDGIGSLHVGIAEAYVNESVADIINPLLWMIAGFLIIGCSVAAVFALTITRPIYALTAAADALGSGQFEGKMQISSKDEIGKLAESFIKMANDLKGAEKALSKVYEELEKKVIERTSELNEELTERKRAEEALFRSNEFNKTVLNSISDAISIIDINDFRIIGVNSAFLNEYGYREEEVIGKTCYAITHLRSEPCKPPHDICPLEETVSHGKYTAAVHVHFDKEGNKIYSEVSTSPVRDETGKTIQVVHISRDITERRRAEEELKEYAETQKVLLSEVNHRVKNNLSAIISMLHIEEDRAEAEGLQTLPVLRDLEGRIMGLSTVHGMLSASAWRPLRLSQLCEEVVRGALKSVPLTKKVEFSITPANERINSRQAHHLTLVLNELATNSAKHALKGRDYVRIDIGIERKDGYVLLRFRDNGPGYPEEMLKGDFSRTGVGFDLINGIARKSLHGRLELKNDNGAVTTVAFRSKVE